VRWQESPGIELLAIFQFELIMVSLYNMSMNQAQPTFDQTIDYTSLEHTPRMEESIPGGGDSPLTHQSSPEGYEVISELGRGGMGVVYLASQKKLGRQVALKMILAGGYSSQAERQRFLAEAEAVAAVSHPNIVQIYDLGAHEELPYFALEYCSGGSLAQKLLTGPLPPFPAAQLIEKLARGIEAAHDKKIIHRDLKPANILLTDDGNPKITDFGLARRTESQSGLTQSGAILGTPSYMAPEQATSSLDEISPATDVYALGAILYECLTGRPPFRAPTLVETIGQLLNDEPVSPSNLMPGLPRDLETICLKALQKRPKNRYPTALQLAEDLARFTRGDAILARPASRVEKTYRLIRRHPALSSLAIAFVVGLGVLFAVVSAANVRLQKEKALAQSEKAKAEQRVDITINAIDRVLARTTTEKWTRSPDLMEERRNIIEDAVSVYSQFLEGDSSQPRLRQKSADAHFKISGVKLILGDVDSAKSHIQSAIELSEGLEKEFPDTPDYQREIGLYSGFLGHCSLLEGDSDGGKSYYQRQLEIGETLSRRYPTEARYRELLIEGIYNLATYSQNEWEQAKAYYQRMRTESETILTTEPTSYAARLYNAIANLNIESRDEAQKKPSEKTLQSFASAVAAFDKLAAEKPPTPSLTQKLDGFRTIKDGFQASMYERAGEFTKAIESYNKVLAAYRETLKRQPRNFPTRLNLLNALMYKARAALRSKQPELEKSVNREIVAEGDTILAFYPKLPWLSAQIAFVRTNSLIADIRDGQMDQVDQNLVKIEETLKLLTPEEARLHFRYNMVCVYATLVTKKTGEAKAQACNQAIRELKILADAGYFQDPQIIKHLDKDTDIDPIRNEAQYIELRKSLK
jgi:serine/threonine protein kinase